MKASRLIVLAFAIGMPAVCGAQWRWVDKTGRTVFSDQPPPPDTPAASILRQPSGKASPADEAAAPPAAAKAPPPLRAAASAAKPGPKERELQEKKKQLEAAEQERKKAEEEEAARARADNCDRAKRSKAAFDSGMRIARMNDKGEREILDDAQRGAEVKRLDALIARDCKAAGSP